MRIGVVSDNHGHMANTMQAVTQLEQHNVDAVLHCGDIVSADTIPLFAEWPTHFVFGNCDGNTAALRRTIEDAQQTCHGRFGDLTLAGRRIALLHSDDARRFNETIASGEYDLVCYGHTHEAESHHDGLTLVLNPGALYRAKPLSFAIVDLETMQVQPVILSPPG